MNTKKKVLVVEDEVSLLRALIDKFNYEDFETLEAKNGKEGLKIAFQDHPDLILLDILMPVMDGMTMLKKLREDEWGKSAKVIILSNLSDSQKVAEAVEQGSFKYLVKTDWTLEDIVVKVRDRLRE